MLYGSYVVLGIAIFYTCFVFCMRNKIRLAIALNQVRPSQSCFPFSNGSRISILFLKPFEK